jgi:hypothetical protein
MRTRSFFLASFVLSLSCGLAVLACGDDDNGGRTGTDGGGSEGGTDGSSGEGGGGAAKQTGKIVVALQNVPLPGATVTIGSASAQSKPDGTYEIGITKGSPLQMQVTAEDYYKLFEQEYVVKTDTFDRGESSLLSKAVASTLVSFLQGRDDKKGLLIVKVQPVAPCDSEEGTVVSLDPPGSSMVRYISGGIPSNSLTAAKKGESFHAVVYNIDLGAPVNVKLTSPLCKQKAFPVDVDNVTYTGKNQKVEGGEVLSFMRVFLGDKQAAADAGDDASDAAPE